VNENVKVVFRAYPRQKYIDLRQTKIKVSSCPLYTYLQQRKRFVCVRFLDASFGLLIETIPVKKSLRAKLLKWIGWDRYMA